MIIDNLLSIFFGTKHERDIKKLTLTVNKINTLERETEKLSDEELFNKTAQFKNRLEQGEKIKSILPEAFATVREAAKRKLGIRLFDVQLMGGIVLHQGKIAEMKTGEGKTFAALMPVYLNSLTGKGVHVVTVNDYLARRDAEWIKPVYEALGLSTGIIQQDMDPVSRKNAYSCDVTYGTNSEFGFDYLRDNMAEDASVQVQRELNYAIIDEVDSILIDEARTPLIISGPADDFMRRYEEADKIVRRLHENADYSVNKKERTALLTESGVEKIEKILKIDNLYDISNIENIHIIDQALRAHALFKRDVDYITQDGEIVIVDEFTGRTMPGKRYSDGLHQAIEAKEKVKVQRENQTYATISIQNFFRLYSKLAGMTGTADTEAVEFKKTYKLDAVVIPTNKLMIRKDYIDRIFDTEENKFSAVADEIEELYSSGRPVLAGTVSVEKSEKLSGILKTRGIPHRVLNAKQHENEARIIAEAGKPGSVTIATNMAGRGVDIILGGSKSFINDVNSYEAHDPESWTFFKRKVITGDYNGSADMLDKIKEPDKKTAQSIIKKWDEWEENHRTVSESGGLHIIGTERHEARRIDNQLRGRSGRQGDKGSSGFYVSLEDHLVRNFATGPNCRLPKDYEIDENGEITNRTVHLALEKAQKRIETYNFEIRKHMLEYDDVMNFQRDFIYNERKRLLSKTDLQATANEYIEKLARDKIREHIGDKTNEHSLSDEINGWLISGFNIDPEPEGLSPENHSPDELAPEIEKLLIKQYNNKIQSLGSDGRAIEQMIFLYVLDARWREHLLNMDDLRDGVWTMSYSERNPIYEYKITGAQLFNETISRIRYDAISTLLKAGNQIAGRYMYRDLSEYKPINAIKTVPDPDKMHYIKNPSGGVKRIKTRRGRKKISIK